MSKRARFAALTAIPLVAGSLAAATSAEASPTSQAGSVQVIANHLNNPRGLAVRGDSVYIAESGNGDPNMCLTIPGNPPSSVCVGLSGAVSVVSSEGGLQSPKRIVTGLFSLADPTGIGSQGPAAVSLKGGRISIIQAGNTSGIPPTVPPNFRNLLKAAKAQIGQLIIARRSGAFKPVLGVGDLDYQWAARHKNLVPSQFPDSNPNAVLVVGHTTYVVDAGANTLDTIRHGKIVHRVFFPAPAGSVTDSVPTCVSRGPDGALYVGELLGGNPAPGHARVWRVTAHSKKVWATGLTAVNGCGWGRDGNFYATEFQTAGLNPGPTGNPAGDVVRISPNGKTVTHLGVGQLNVPSGFAAGEDAIFVSNCSISPTSGFGPCPNGGELVRIPTGEEDHD